MPFDFAGPLGDPPIITPLVAHGATGRPLDQPLICAVDWTWKLGGLGRHPSTIVRFGDPLAIVARDVAPIDETPVGIRHPRIGGVWRQTVRVDPGPLALGTTYHWQVEVRNHFGWFRSSPVFSFTTAVAPAPPAVPSLLNPTDNGGSNGLTPILAWVADTATRYDVYFGLSDPPALVSAGQVSATYTPGSLMEGTEYFLRIVAINSAGTTSGPVWSFTGTRVVTPAMAPALALAAGAGLAIGAYRYAYSAVATVGGVESARSPEATITTSVFPTAVPSGTPTATQNPVEFEILGTDWAIGDVIDYVVTYVTALGETGPTALSNAITALASDVPGRPRSINVEALPVPTDPAVTAKRIYRRRNGVWAGYYQTGDTTSTNPFDPMPLNAINWFDVGEGRIHPGSPPASSPVLTRVAVSGIAAGAAGTAARKLYRTAVDDSQLKLVTTIADNTTTTYTDSTPDGSLGPNAP
jgi:hypothetical protein